MSQEIISREEAWLCVQDLVLDETMKQVDMDSALLKQIGSLPIYEFEGIVLYVNGSHSSFICQINAYDGEVVGLKNL